MCLSYEIVLTVSFLMLQRPCISSSSVPVSDGSNQISSAANPFPNGIDLSHDQQEFTFKSSAFKLTIPGGPSFILPPGYQLPPALMAQIQAAAAHSTPSPVAAPPPALPVPVDQSQAKPTPSGPVDQPRPKPQPIAAPPTTSPPPPQKKGKQPVQPAPAPAATEYYGESGGYAGYGVRRYGNGNRNVPYAVASNDY